MFPFRGPSRASRSRYARITLHARNHFMQGEMPLRNFVSVQAAA
jgi:hypothetical protein